MSEVIKNEEVKLYGLKKGVGLSLIIFALLILSYLSTNSFIDAIRALEKRRGN